MVEVRIHKLDKNIETPKYARKGDAAFDLRSAEEKTIKAGHKELFKTGLRIAIPEDFCGLIWDRGGMAARHGIHCLAGVLDAGYRGELVLVLHNLSKEDFFVEKNMRVAQMIVQPFASAIIKEVEELEDTERSDGKFSSTGLH